MIKQYRPFTLMLKTIDDFVKINQEYCNMTGLTERKKFAKQVDEQMSRLDAAIKGCDVSKIKFTTVNKLGETVYVYVTKRETRKNKIQE